MKNYDEQVKIQERLRTYGIFSSSLVPSPYADIIEQLLNKLDRSEIKVLKVPLDANVEEFKKQWNSVAISAGNFSLNVSGVVNNGNGLQSNETNTGKSEDEPVHAAETTASPSTGSTSPTTPTTEPTEPTA